MSNEDRPDYARRGRIKKQSQAEIDAQIQAVIDRASAGDVLHIDMAPEHQQGTPVEGGSVADFVLGRRVERGPMGGGIPAPDVRPSASFWWRGEVVEVHSDDPLSIVLMCLLALKDPRVDAILGAMPMQIPDIHGRIIWPVEPQAPADDEG